MWKYLPTRMITIASLLLVFSFFSPLSAGAQAGEYHGPQVHSRASSRIQAGFLFTCIRRAAIPVLGSELSFSLSLRLRIL